MSENWSYFTGGGLKDGVPSFGAIPRPDTFPAPIRLDSSDRCLPASYQGDIPCCASEALTGNIAAWKWWKRDDYDKPDAVKVWREDHRLTNETNDNEGSTMEGAVNAATYLGVMPVTPIWRVDTLMDFRYAIHRNMWCIMGFRIDANWNRVDSETGRIGSEPNMAQLGNHAVLGVGYDDTTETVKLQNSWGLGYGKHGFCSISYEQFNVQKMYGIVLELRL